MEDEGIMALPQGQEPMQNQELPAVTSADSYDAATTALGRLNPEQLAAYKQAINQEIQGLELSPAEIETLIEIVEYLSQRPKEYPELLKQLIEQDYVDQGDLPDQYDPVYLGTMLSILNELKLSMTANVQAPMEMAPEVEGLGPLPMAEGGLADMARLLAAQGRGGDTMLAHITPEEARLLKARGGAGTINPATGLPEFFLKNIFKGIKKVVKAVGKAVKSALKNPLVRIVASVALATVLGPTAIGATLGKAGTAALASTTVAAASGANLKESLIAGATSYFGAGGTIGGVNPAAAVASRVGQYLPGGASGAIAQGIGAGVTGAGIGLLTGASPEEALRMGALSGLTTGATQAFQNWMASQPQVQQPTQAQTQPVNRGLGELPPEDFVTAPAAGAPTTAQGPVTTTAPTTAPAASQVGVAAPGAVPTASGLRDVFTRLPEDYPVDAATGLPVQPATTFAGRLREAIQLPSVQTFKDAFLVNPYATGLGKFAPAALTTVGIGALTGGFKQQPVDQNPLFDRNYRGLDFMRDNPQLFGGSLGRVEGVPQAYNPVVTTPSYATLPVTTPPVVVPRGITLQPRGIPQPYNVAGLYGVPELSAPVQQPVYMANGGDVSERDYQQNRFSSTLDLMNMNPGMTYNQALELINKFQPRQPKIIDPTANFSWGADLKYDPTIYANQFNWQKYIAANPDLAEAGIDTPWEAATHYSNYGKQEGRAGVEFLNSRYGQPEVELDPTSYEAKMARLEAMRESGQLPAAPAPVAPTQTTPSTPARPVTASFQPAFFNSMSFNPAAPTEAISSLGSPDIPQQTLPSFLTAPAMFGGIRRREDVAQPYNVAGLYMPTQEQPQMFNKGGQPTHFPRKTGPINGPGTGTSDSIPAMLSDGEFVFTAKAVRNAGGGSRRKGAKRMYALMKKLEGGPVKGNA